MSDNPFLKLSEIKSSLPRTPDKRHKGGKGLNGQGSLNDPGGKTAGEGQNGHGGQGARGDRDSQGARAGRNFPDADVSLPPSLSPTFPDGPAETGLSPEEELFLRAMDDEGVKPLDGCGKHYIPLPPDPDSFPVSEEPDDDAWALQRLTELVNGDGEFDFSFTDEFVEGHVKGLPSIMLKKLREGQPPPATFLDLHGFTLAQAKEELSTVIPRYTAMGFRMVLIIHGKGLRSPDGIPVLKLNLGNLLLRTSIRKYILAFVTAKPCDGGTGACYVLLRRKKATGKQSRI